MGIKKLALILSVVIGISSCGSQSNKQESKEEVLFKDFVLAICLGTAFRDTAVAIDANRAANGYMEYGNMPIEAYEASRTIVKDWLRKDYASKSGDQIDIMKCIDLYRSSDLEGVFEKYSPCGSKEGWLDPSDYSRQCE